jgi:hypothetical protein
MPANNSWAVIEKLCANMAIWLQRAGAAEDAKGLSAQTEQAIDDWVRAYLRAPGEYPFPTDADMQRGLLARCSHVAAIAKQAVALEIPFPRGSDGDASDAQVTEAMLIGLWHQQNRTSGPS